MNREQEPINRLNPIQKLVNVFSNEYCETSGEKYTVETGWNGEGKSFCEPCVIYVACKQKEEFNELD